MYPKIDTQSAAILLIPFGIIVFWFNITEFYDHNFFDHGLLVFLNNSARVGFIGILLWLVYAPGSAVTSILMARWGPRRLTNIEKALIAFAIGAAIWHVLLLILGVAGLYYRTVMVFLCATVLLLSSRHFGEVKTAARLAISRRLRGPLQRPAADTMIGIVFCIVCAVWLLLVRGLYPGGSGDYYTHYFYYYIEVIKNHGLEPNQVWYHYYYSKGYGLFFLGMLLTDPEAPAPITFGFVLVAAIGLIALGQRMAPRTLWPWWLAVLYLMFNLVNFDLNFGGGDFQKDHEQVSALILLVAIALCMARVESPRIWLTAAIASGITVAIIAQPMGVIVGTYFIFLATWSAACRRWRQMRQYGLAGLAVGAAVGALLTLNYCETGLFSDQLLGLMLRFADIARLDRWGVVPQLPIIAWIRDNYRMAPPPWGPGVWPILRHFLWVDTLWIVLAAAAVALGWGAARTIVLRVLLRRAVPPHAAIVSNISATVLTEIGLMVAILALISLGAGWAQPISFLRSSTFFFPLLLLFATACVCWTLTGASMSWRSALDRALPALLLAGSVFLWSANNDWIRRVEAATENALSFSTGSYSLADGYSHQGYGQPYGGIDPETYAAAQQVPHGTPIWSTNVASYCMVPGCWIESTVSFTMSPRLEEILAAPPERAEQLLRQAGLNYFLFSKNAQLLDLLPYSKLFAPDTIGRYLGMKWTDGTEFLLTWIGNDTTPLGTDFMKVYADLLAQPEMEWFQFSQLVPQLGNATAALRAKRWGRRVLFAWEAPPPLEIMKATYGMSCRGYPTQPPLINRVSEGNVTALMHRACLDQASCLFRVDVGQLGDPAPGCPKDFSVTYRCESDGTTKTAQLPAEANGKSVTLDCPGSP